jgi:hypothetical protein
MGYCNSIIEAAGKQLSTSTVVAHKNGPSGIIINRIGCVLRG